MDKIKPLKVDLKSMEIKLIPLNVTIDLLKITEQDLKLDIKLNP